MIRISRRVSLGMLTGINPKDGAGEGNRTLVIWLGTRSSTIELHPLEVPGILRGLLDGAQMVAEVWGGVPSSLESARQSYKHRRALGYYRATTY
jgi:hypothetical protein